MATLWLSGRHHAGFLMFTFLLLAVQQVLNHIFIYWDIDAAGLRERRLWSTREVPWREVTHIGGWPTRPSSNYLEIGFARPAPISERGSVIANPEDRGGFIAALHKFAPQAEFDV